MLISLRDDEGKLAAKDVLDIDFDMSIASKENRDGYYVRVNRWYRLNEEFGSEDEAEEAMLHLVNVRNALENELRNY